MSAKFTNGPWSRNVPPARKYNTIFAGRNTHVAHLAVVGIGDSEIEANARLIAKAPELYEVLRQIVSLDKDANPGLATWMEARCAADKTARALLAEIEGE